MPDAASALPPSPGGHEDEPAADGQGGHDGLDEAERLPEPWALGPGRAALIAGGLVLVGIGIFAATWLPERARTTALADAAQAAVNRRPAVLIAIPKPGEPTQTVTLPGTLSPAQETTLYARSNGYVASWSKDLGDAVHAGDVLAVIAAPDLDAQVVQAQAQVAQSQAQLAQGQANAVLAKISLKRQQDLGPQLTPQQSIDEAQAGYDAALATVQLDQATIASDRAALQHLQAEVGFERVLAPFDGIVTARSIQVGSLINGAAATGSGQALFQVTQIDPILVYAAVPQTQAAAMAPGSAVTVTVRGFGATPFTGTITRIAHRLDDAAHTMTAEVELPNHDHRLMPGMYATVALHVPTTTPLLTVPSNALILGAQGATVGVLTRDDRVHLQPVVIDTDTGSLLSISSGLRPDDRVVLNAGENITEGVEVEIVEPETDAPGH
jgi:RND family efflux transporter MFP subunit